MGDVSLPLVDERFQPGRGEGGGVLPEKLSGVRGPLPKTLTLFMIKICDFPHPTYDLTLNKTMLKMLNCRKHNL